MRCADCVFVQGHPKDIRCRLEDPVAPGHPFRFRPVQNADTERISVIERPVEGVLVIGTLQEGQEG